ncbi:hypothetical protein M885DRAFT_592453, partial [Pelagophyceae sp. CCMP2097]
MEAFEARVRRARTRQVPIGAHAGRPDRRVQLVPAPPSASGAHLALEAAAQIVGGCDRRGRRSRVESRSIVARAWSSEIVACVRIARGSRSPESCLPVVTDGAARALRVT